MRVLFGIILAGALSASALAQTVVTLPQPPGLGGFEFRANPDAVRASTPAVEWEVISDPELRRGTMRSRAPVTELEGVPFVATIAFAADQTTFIRLTANVPLSRRECEATHRRIVEAQIAVRGQFFGRQYLHRFYDDPDAPTGRMDGNVFIPSPGVDARAIDVVMPAASPEGFASLIEKFNSGDRWYFASSGPATTVTAFFWKRDGADECRFNIAATDRGAGSGALRVAAGEGGEQRLRDRLAQAEFERPLTYLSRPSSSDASRYYPPRALDREVQGDVVLNCLVLADGTVDCMILSETPPDREFGRAALRIARLFRADVFSGSVGKRTEITVPFRLAS